VLVLPVRLHVISEAIEGLSAKNRQKRKALCSQIPSKSIIELRDVSKNFVNVWKNFAG
jgi:hypothetical protein